MNIRLKVVSALAVLAGIQACNALVGVDDVHLRDDTAGASGAAEASGGDAEQGGSPSQGVTQGGDGTTAQAGAGSPSTGGEPNTSGAPSTDAAGAPTSEGGAGGAAGAGNTAGETSACPIRGEDRGGGKLTLVQFAPLDAPRSRLAITKDGKNAYSTTWGDRTQHFARDRDTGKLTPKSKAGVYNGELAILSENDKHLYVGGTNGLQFYDILIAADGTIADTPSTNGPSYTASSDAVRVGETIFIAAFGSIRTISNGVYDSTDRAAPGDYDDILNLTRIGDYLYWTEYARGAYFPANAPSKVGRMRVHCDGTSGPREAFPTGRSPMQVAGCNEDPRYLYVNHPKVQTVAGYVDIVDLQTCDTEFASCVPIKKVTGADVPGFDDPQDVHMSPDCTTLYVTVGSPAGGVITVLDLQNPLEPKAVQTFQKDVDYGGITLTGNVNSAHITWFDDYVYIPFAFGDGVGVFKPER